jgi:hypothetical protein
MSEPSRGSFLSGDFGEHQTEPGRSERGPRAAGAALPPIVAAPHALPGLLAAARLGFVAACRSLSRRRLLLVAALGVALALAAGAIERRVGSLGAVDRALNATFGLLVPLGSFAIVLEATRHERLAAAAWPLARYGVARRDVAFGIVVAAVLAAALLGAILALAAVITAHSASALPLAGDAAISARVGALAAAAYAGWFSFGATFLKRGRGAWIPLVADFVVGGTSGVFGTLLPRGNAHNLLGGAAPLGLPQSSSSAILIGAACMLSFAAALRCGD